MTDKINILYVITSLDVGGAQKMILETVKGLDKNRYNLNVCSLKKKNSYVEEFRLAGVAPISLLLPDKVNLFYLCKLPVAFIKLMKIMKENKVTIVHSYLFQANLLSRIAARFVKVPVIISSIRIMEMQKASHLWFDKLTNCLIDKIITNAEAVRQFIISKTGVSPDKIVTIHNGINTKHNLNQEKMFSGEKLNLPLGADIIGSIGRLHEQKGFNYLLQALVLVKKEQPNFKCILVGDGKLKNYLNALSKEYNLTENMIFTGFRKDMDEIISVFDVFVLSSLWEGLPNVIMEAMNQSKPVIATAVGGTAELVQDKITGLLVPARDPAAMAQSILWILKNKEEARIMGQNGRSRIEKLFSLEKMIQKTETIYEQLLAEKVKRGK